MRRALAPTLALVLAPGAVAPVAVGQQTSPPEPDAPIGGLAFVDEYNLTVVNLIVHVTDGAGNPVTGLGRDSFRVFQDGEEREITNFVPYTKEVYRSHYDRADLPPLLARLNIEPSQWLKTATGIERHFSTAIGPVASLQQFCERIKQRWVHGIGACRIFYASSVQVT